MSSQRLMPSADLANRGEQGQSKNLETFHLSNELCCWYAGLLWWRMLASLVVWALQHLFKAATSALSSVLSSALAKRELHSSASCPFAFLDKTTSPPFPMQWCGSYWIFNNKTPLSSFVAAQVQLFIQKNPQVLLCRAILNETFSLSVPCLGLPQPRCSIFLWTCWTSWGYHESPSWACPGPCEWLFFLNMKRFLILWGEEAEQKRDIMGHTVW